VSPFQFAANLIEDNSPLLVADVVGYARLIEADEAARFRRPTSVACTQESVSLGSYSQACKKGPHVCLLDKVLEIFSERLPVKSVWTIREGSAWDRGVSPRAE
jgi:hypothetical protein